jgi:ATP-dependent Clp protease ATP-binding subunit ClpC
VFERFTDRARRVVVLAQEEARMLDHHYIGTEHLLLGLIHEGEGVASIALRSLDISLPAVRHEIETAIGRGAPTPPGHIPFTPRAKKVLELSLREALQLGHAYIGTEHILLGLIREGEGVAAQVLEAMGAHLSRVRDEVIHILGATGTGAASPGEPGEAGEPGGGRAEGRARAEQLHRLALEEMRMLGDDVLGPDHLYLAQLGQRIQDAEQMRQELASARRSLWQARRSGTGRGAEGTEGTAGDDPEGVDDPEAPPEEPAGGRAT